MKTLSAVLLVSVACAAAQAAQGMLAASHLRCEYLADPSGIDAALPRLSWIVESAQRGQSQSAYRVLVASSSATLQADKGDLWDSGKVDSNETACIRYAGKPLASNQACVWKVQVFDAAGKASDWSKPASFSTGLLQQDDWKAQWIGYDKKRKIDLPEAKLDGAKWIWHAADPANPPQGHRLFVTTFELPADAKIASAQLQMAADDSYKAVLNTRNVAGGTSWQVVQMVDVAGDLKGGTNDLRVEVANASPSPAGLLGRLEIKLAGGKTIVVVTDGSWKSLMPFPYWHKNPIAASKTASVKVLGEYGMQPWGKVKASSTTLPPAVYLRTIFTAEKDIRRAVLYSTALGIHDMYLNGQRVSDDYFNPGWTDYTKRVYARAYDVTDGVKKGTNALGGILADGWFSGYVGFGKKRDHYGDKPRLRAQLHIEYADGSTAVVATGPQWKASTGAYLEADFLMGETYDARLAPTGWDTASFDAAAWEAVDVGTTFKPLMQAHPAPPVRVIGQFKSIKTVQSGPGTYILNLGQNFAGLTRLKIKGQAGQKIVLRFAERLNTDGSFYVTNLREARCIDTYICRGDGEEVYVPRFTFHGFQYVEISGLDAPPAEDTIVGLALSSDTDVAGEFACNDAMLNKLHSNIYWTQRSNFIDIPTDCPQRDERLGWTGDAQVYIRTATLNTDVQAFFNKWLVDLADAQRDDGQFPMVAPLKVAGGDGGPAWADAGTICPWTVYQVYGDKDVLARQYPTMAKFVEFCRKRCTPELLPPKQFHCFGDWLSINANTPKDVIFQAYFAASTKLTANAAEVLGKADDAKKYNDLFEQIKAAFNKAYVDGEGKIKGNTQCVYVLALAYDLLDEATAKKAAEHLVKDIESRKWHLSTGFIGTKDLMLVLAKIGRNDVAYRLLHNDTFPSWGFSIKHGATSIWERWDGWTPEKGFQDAGMNSFAHYSFGAVYQWMVENIGGIRSASPSYKDIVIAPQTGGKLTQATIGYGSVRGLIRTSWRRQGAKLSLEVTVPANTTATVHVPAKAAGDVTESGKSLDRAEGVKFLRMDGGAAVVTVGGGTYRFESRQ